MNQNLSPFENTWQARLHTFMIVSHTNDFVKADKVTFR